LTPGRELDKVQSPKRNLLRRGQAYAVKPVKLHDVQSHNPIGDIINDLFISRGTMATDVISVVNHAPHVSAAKLFIDFAISDEGQKILVQRGRESTKPGLKPEGYPRASQSRSEPGTARGVARRLQPAIP
jgi:ABC-type uncharacterized transport system YnjBCD substrate-binding protein